MDVSVSKSVEMPTLCMRLYLASILCDTCHRETRLAHWPCTRDAFNDFCQGSLDCFGWLMKVLCSQLGPSMDAIRSLTLYPWYSPQHAKGCLLHAPPGYMRTLSGVGPASIVGWPKCPAVLVPPKKQLAGVMGKPEVTCGTKLWLFAPLTILTIYHSWLPLSCLISLSLKGFPRNTFQIKNSSQVLLWGNPMKTVLHCGLFKAC